MARQIIQPCSQAWHTLEILWGLIAQVQDALHHLWCRRGWWAMAGARAAPQDLLIIESCLIEALAPFLDPAERTSQTFGYLSR
jgi:hypothetical protein